MAQRRPSWLVTALREDAAKEAKNVYYLHGSSDQNTFHVEHKEIGHTPVAFGALALAGS
jgi:hypothetical protein